jgi:hypothetical protein
LESNCEIKARHNEKLAKTWESVPPVANLRRPSLDCGCKSILNTGSRLCQDISGIAHFILCYDFLFPSKIKREIITIIKMSLLFSLFLCTGLYRQQQKPISVARLIKMPTRCKFYSFQIKKKKKFCFFLLLTSEFRNVIFA